MVQISARTLVIMTEAPCDFSQSLQVDIEIVRQLSQITSKSFTVRPSPIHLTLATKSIIKLSTKKHAICLCGAVFKHSSYVTFL
jgi:hypothetical protein